MLNTQPIPTRTDIVIYGSLDEISACEHFLGKSLKEAEVLFRDNALHYQEDLLWMGPVAFRYYVRAAIAYVESEDGEGDADVISGLARTLSLRQEQQPAELVPCARLLADFCRRVLAQFDRHDADPVIYRGLRKKYQTLAALFTRGADASLTP